MVIHNADFDVGFLDAEFKIASSTYPSISEICEIKDTLAIARNKFRTKEFPSMHFQNVLKSMATIEVIWSLLDANILADVYSNLTVSK